MEKPLLDLIDWWNNILWLVECLLDIYCDVVDLYYINHEIHETVSRLPLAYILCRERHSE